LTTRRMQPSTVLLAGSSPFRSIANDVAAVNTAVFPTVAVVSMTIFCYVMLTAAIIVRHAADVAISSHRLQLANNTVIPILLFEFFLLIKK